MKTYPPSKRPAFAHVWRFGLWAFLAFALSVQAFSQNTFSVVTSASQALSLPAGTFTYYVDVLPGGSTSYNAASVPPNVLAGRAGIGNCVSCPSGHEVHQLLGHAAAGEGTITFNDISVPNPGTYNGTFVYFCGKSDNNGDPTCGGGPHTASGCRPAIFVVNGVREPGTNQFPCFPGPWSQPHMQTFSIPLQAGSSNTLHMFSTSADMADLDRLIVSNGTSTEAVTLSVSSLNNHLPAGATISWCSTSVIAPCTGSASSVTITPPGIATLTISTGSGTGTFPFVINGQFGGETETASTALAVGTAVPTPTVTPTTTPTPNPPAFTLSVAPPSLTVDAGSSGAYTVTVSGEAHFSGAVALSVTGLPSGVTAVFNPPSISGIPGVSTATLTVSAAANAPAVNAASLTIAATGPFASHTATVTLSIPTGTPPQCVSTVNPGMWTNSPFTTQAGSFTAQFDATANAAAGATVNDVIGLSNGAQTSIANFPVLVSFSDTGHFVARNAGAYTATTVLNYTAGVTYHFRVAVSVTTLRYSVFVTPPGGTEVLVANNFAFRTGVTPSSLNSVGSNVITPATTGSIAYCGFTIN